MKNIEELLEVKLLGLQESLADIFELVDNDEEFNACDASGGNFDDAYDLGYGHGVTEGQQMLIVELLRLIKDEKGEF